MLAIFVVTTLSDDVATTIVAELDLLHRAAHDAVSVAQRRRTRLHDGIAVWSGP